MKIELYSYNTGIYCDLDDAQEDGAIYVLSDDVGTLNYTSLKDIAEIAVKTAKEFADKRIAVFVKTGGIDHSFESMTYDLEQSPLTKISDIARHSRNSFESEFERVRASISWQATHSTTEMVTIANTSLYVDLEPCGFCDKCDYCKVSASYFTYANSLTELDQYLNSYHPDGWKINYYSVEA